ncbi:hypothetical protein SVAN01_06821 [Stagonosporopsis vannaccii]|nr:hypothetical protein SVAN01_06821 [Stagonosporopsis vannaccii]
MRGMLRLRYMVKTSRVKKAMQDDWLRREREWVWEEAHQEHLLKADSLSTDEPFHTTCVVCAAAENRGVPSAKPIMSLTTAWWEREGALVAGQVLLPKPLLCPTKKTTYQSRLRSKHPSHLRDFISSYREMRTVSEDQRQAWEDRCKLDRAIRRKYDLDVDHGIDPEILALPMPASHAGHHHRQIQSGLKAG